MQRVLQLLTSHAQGDAGYVELAEWLDELYSSTKTAPAFTDAELFNIAFAKATRIVERSNPARLTRKTALGIHGAQTAYKMIQDTLRRLDAGEILDDIAAARAEAMKARGEELKAAHAAAEPETLDPDVVCRARAILADTDRYNMDTRRFIRNSLAYSDPAALAEDVRRAEAGERLEGLATELDVDAPTLTLAELLSEVMNHPELPAALNVVISKVLAKMLNDLDHVSQKAVLTSTASRRRDAPTYISHLLEKHKTEKGVRGDA